MAPLVVGTILIIVAAASAGVKPDSLSRAADAGAADMAPVKHIVLTEQKIEGKIRRPQLVLIKADQRPEFSPMVIQTVGKTQNIAALVDQSLIEAPQKGVFRFQGTAVISPAP